ncbi:endo-1,4-beta-xylanase [Confluentibacter sediminis]|uniref:endo-1,4-beta-xylanase n=1 Tax=Confluentibacter sediminis TaxID=2219045 RepID=UPI000DAD7974|nr:endo-1,4-beta-xylanase [Confluentibacter sediminis]
MKNFKKILQVTFMLGAIVTSCTDYERPEFTVDKPESIASQELINEYDGLKSYLDTIAYPNFKLGADLVLSDYNAKALVYRLINNNFNEVTFNEGVQHGDMVKEDGSFDFSGLESLFEITQSNGMSVFGKNLISNKQQNADYLNGLLEPIVIENPVNSNSLNKSGLNDLSFTNWEYNMGADVSIIDFNGLKTIKMVSGANASNPQDLNLITSDIPVVQGHEYEIIMYVRSDSEGTGRISFEGLSNNTPEIDWDESGTASANFSTDVKWKQIRFKVSDFTSNTIKLHFDFGYQPNTTYYINLGSLYVYDTDAAVGSNAVWLEAECGEYGADWVAYTSDTNVDATPASEGAYLMVPDGTKPTGNQGGIPAQNINLKFVVSEAGDYSVYVRAAARDGSASSDSFFVTVDNGGWTDMNNRGIATTPFKWFKVNSYPLSKGSHIINVAMREDGCKIDKFYVALNGVAPQITDSNNTIIGGQAENCVETGFNLERTSSEKTTIVGDELNRWVSEVVTYSKDYVKAWNVVDEPMDDQNPYEVKSGLGMSAQSGEFYWQDYLGKDYGVVAFKKARENGNADDLLFISDFGLETDLDKCRGLIQYVEYLETQGAQVDGIGAKIHLTIDSDKDNIADMLQLLVATGKQIAISDIYVQVLTSTPTDETFQKQADMYKDIVQIYLDNVPASQRYGITIRGVIDNNSNSSWLPEEELGLWNVYYIRKPAYVGFAEGLKLLKN